MEDGIEEHLQTKVRFYGSIENEECKIDSIAQSWATISNAGDNDKKFISMSSLENHLVDKENGIIKLLDPPFEKSTLEPGYIKSYLPGTRENGGQYTHECCDYGQFYIGIQPHDIRLHKLSVTRYARIVNLILILLKIHIVIRFVSKVFKNTPY